MLKKNGNYKPRNKKFKYLPVSKEEFDKIQIKYKNIYIEDTKSDKNPCVFVARNIFTDEEVVWDNQTAFAKKYGLNQAVLSSKIINDGIYEDWEFKLLEKIDYKNSTSYKNLTETINDIELKDIQDGEILIFSTGQEAKDYLGLRGHDLRSYYNNNRLILNRYKVIHI